MLAEQKRKAYAIKTPKPVNPKTPKSKRSRVIEDESENDSSESSDTESGKHKEPTTQHQKRARQRSNRQGSDGGDEDVATEEEDNANLALSDQRAPHVKVAVEFDSKLHRGKLVVGAFVHVTDPKVPGQDSVYAAVLTKNVELHEKKAHITYVNDETARNTEVEMVFTETEPAYKDKVFLKEIKYIMPTGRVKKNVIEGAEDDDDGPKHEWWIDIQSIPSVQLDPGDIAEID